MKQKPIIKYILLVYSTYENKPYLLTWLIVNTKAEIIKEHYKALQFDQQSKFYHYSYKWIAFKLTTKSK